jgi:SAM-dependent methyltransferase
MTARNESEHTSDEPRSGERGRPDHTDTAAAAKAWDGHDLAQVRSVAWNSVPGVGRHIANRFTGATDSNWALLVHDLLSARVPDAQRNELRGVAIACGDMASERDVFEHRSAVSFVSVDGFDVAADALSRYAPQSLVWTPHAVDVNRLDLAPSAYDLAVGSHGLHHIHDLARTFEQLHGALRPHGLLYAYEWIGPEYLQLPRRNRLLAILLLTVLFSRRERTTHEGHRKGRSWMAHRPDELDPTEACNSTRLLPELLARFRPLRRHDHGGVLYPVLEGIGQNLDLFRRRDRARVRLLLVLDDLASRSRLVPPLFTILVAEPR